jgi:opacity protein-like surface antigen
MKRHAFLSVITLGLFGFFCFSSVSAWAGTMGEIEPVKSWTWVGTLSAGAVWAKGDETQTFYLASETEKTYLSSESSTALIEGDLFFGVQKILSRHWQGQLGLGLTATGNAQFKGFIWDDADEDFNNYRYDYKVRHRAIALKAKLLLDKNNQLLPWISASLGAGFNRTDKFINTPLIFEAVKNNNFVHHITHTFTYTLGFGLQHILNSHWQVGAGYEFADWGQSELGRAAGQTLNTGLKINHIYTNGFLFNLTYLV